MTSELWSKLNEFDTVYSADSVEWCPHEPYQHVFVCGTYQVKSESCMERLGKIYLFEFKEELNNLQTLNCPAVLDMKWKHKLLNNKMLLGIVDAVGQLVIYELSNLSLTLLCKSNLTLDGHNGDFLLLSLDWSQLDDTICVSDSLGGIHVLTFTQDNLRVLHCWKGHDLEAWIVAFDCFLPMIYTGGDDSKFKVWSLTEPEQPIHTSKLHTSGVTSIHSSKTTPNLLTTGSYDETLLLWDSRNFKQARNTIQMDGGIWRLKWDPHTGNTYLLAACIYGGFHIIDQVASTVVASYKEHESLAYGADWCYLIDNEKYGGSLIATCSFYDHKLTLSVWNNK